MELVDGQLIFSATDLINHLECPHLTHLDTGLALGRLSLTDTRSDTTELVARKGDEHEQTPTRAGASTGGATQERRAALRAAGARGGQRAGRNLSLDFGYRDV